MPRVIDAKNELEISVKALLIARSQAKSMVIQPVLVGVAAWSVVCLPEIAGGYNDIVCIAIAF